MFYMKSLLILPSFHKKTLSHSGNIKIFCPERRMYMYTPPTIYGRSSKWRETINEMDGNIPGGNFLRGNFPGGSLMSGNITGGNFPGGGGNFPRTVSCKMITNHIYSNFYKKSLYVFCLSPVFFYWKFLFYFTLTEKWNKKRNTLTELKYLLFCSSIDLLDVKGVNFQKKFDRW